jgi:hypothetical protein
MMSSAPTISSKGGGRWLYPAPGTRIFTAWGLAWGRLERSGAEYVDGPALAAAVSEATGVHRDTIRNLLHSARNAGLLERTYRKVDVPGRGVRNRTYYRIREV